MRIIITGGCGFVGSLVAKYLATRCGWNVTVIDNFSRPGSERNRAPLNCLGIEVLEGDLRDRNRVENLPPCDWLIDCAANPSVLAGTTPQSPSLELVDHNLLGTIHLLEYCKRHQAGLVLVSTSRVYSIQALAGLPLSSTTTRFELDSERLRKNQSLAASGVSEHGIRESFSTEAPLSLYGATKLASEAMAKEYAYAFEFPLWINRCGLMAGAGQFGRADQGIVAYWMHRYLYRHALKFIGFGGQGHQVRDCLHPDDLARLVELQMKHSRSAEQAKRPVTVNLSGGIESAFSLMELTQWCERRWGSPRFGEKPTVASVAENRKYDAPWIVLDSSLAQNQWAWKAEVSREEIFEEIAEHAEEHSDWLQISQALG